MGSHGGKPQRQLKPVNLYQAIEIAKEREPKEEPQKSTLMATGAGEFSQRPCRDETDGRSKRGKKKIESRIMRGKEGGSSGDRRGGPSFAIKRRRGPQKREKGKKRFSERIRRAPGRKGERRVPTCSPTPSKCRCARE